MLENGGQAQLILERGRRAQDVGVGLWVALGVVEVAFDDRLVLALDAEPRRPRPLGLALLALATGPGATRTALAPRGWRGRVL